MSMFEVFNFLIDDLPNVIGDKLGISPDEIREVFQEYMQEKAKFLKSCSIKKAPTVSEKSKADKKKEEESKTDKKEAQPAKKKKEGMNLTKKKNLKGLIVNEVNLVYDMDKKHFYGRLDVDNLNEQNPEKTVMPLSKKDIEYCLEKELKYLVPEDSSSEQDFQRIEKLLEENKDKRDVLVDIDTFQVISTKEAKDRKMCISKVFNICGTEESIALYEVAHVDEDESDEEDDVCDKAEKEAKSMTTETVNISEKEFKSYLDCIGKGTDKAKVEQIKKTTGLTIMQQKYIQNHEKELKKLYKIK